MPNEESIEELKERIKNATSEEDYIAIGLEMFEKDYPDEVMYEVLQEMHLSEEMKERMEQEEEQVLK